MPRWGRLGVLLSILLAGFVVSGCSRVPESASNPPAGQESDETAAAAAPEDRQDSIPQPGPAGWDSQPQTVAEPTMAKSAKAKPSAVARFPQPPGAGATASRRSYPVAPENGVRPLPRVVQADASRGMMAGHAGPLPSTGRPPSAYAPSASAYPASAPMASMASAPRYYSTGDSPAYPASSGPWYAYPDYPTTGGYYDGEDYAAFEENPFRLVGREPLSTFSIDVDTASYSNMRRFLERGELPPKDAVRIEEMVNYFSYDYAPPEGDVPFSGQVEVAACPWNTEHWLARIALKGKEIPEQERDTANLVFLIDVSGSMAAPNKLPLLKSGMRMLVDNLSERDYVAIVVYAGSAGLVLPSTSCETKEPIVEALASLEAGGSTAGGEGIQLAYQTARERFMPGAVNRVILCTDGDFNVGITDRDELIRMIQGEAKSEVFLSVLGFGEANLKESLLEGLADRGNGTYHYIDSIHEARKVLVEQMGGTLVTIAKDVKIQLDFNPVNVGAYRLIGYENRLLAAEDFDDDTKDAGEIGAGHTVTALYELVPAGKEDELPRETHSKYQRPLKATEAAHSGELFTVGLRYKSPGTQTSKLAQLTVRKPVKSFDAASPDFQFAAAVACFGMLLRDSEHKGRATFDLALELARAGRGEDASGYRSEFLQLVKTAQALEGQWTASRDARPGSRYTPYGPYPSTTPVIRR